MNRKKTKNRIKELKKELKAANRAHNVRLFKFTVVVVILLIVAAFMWPNPVRDSLRHWVRNTLRITTPRLISKKAEYLASCCPSVTLGLVPQYKDVAQHHGDILLSVQVYTLARFFSGSPAFRICFQYRA